MAYKGVTAFALAILTAITGHQYKKLDSLPKDYRGKGDCDRICTAFQNSIDKMTDKMDKGFDRLYDKLDKKEDKHI